jgi:hypothetical protein
MNLGTVAHTLLVGEDLQVPMGKGRLSKSTPFMMKHVLMAVAQLFRTFLTF